MTKELDRLLKVGATVDHHLVEIDGEYCAPTPHVILTKVYPGALVRIGRHLYMDGFELTLDAPKWKLLFPEANNQ